MQIVTEDSTRSLVAQLTLEKSVNLKKEIDSMLESYNSMDTIIGSIQAFVEGVTRSQLDRHSSDFKIYIELLKNPDSSIRQDFDEMVILDLITSPTDRTPSNYIIDINKGKLYAIDHSTSFVDSPISTMSWILDAKESQIWQTPISPRMRQLIMGINFSKITFILQEHHFDPTQIKYIQQGIKKLQSIVRKNKDISLEDIVKEMGEFSSTIELF